MKKALIGIGVVMVFVIYSLWVRHEQPKVGTVSAITSPTTSSSSGSANNNTSNNGMMGNGAMNSPMSSGYKDGSFTGDSTDASYGNVQVAAIISGGKLVDVNVLQYPNTHDTSVVINQQALPMLKQEAIQAQNPNNIQIISGATFTSQAFIQSLATAMNKAQNA